MRRSGAQSASEKDGHGFIQKSRADVEVQNALPIFRGEAGFFQRLAFGAGEGALVRILASGRQLPEVSPGGMAVLPLEQNARRSASVIHRQYHDRPGMVNHVATSRDSTGFAYLIGRHRKYRAAKYHF